MLSKKGFLKSSLLVIFILILFHGINNFIWLQLNQRPPVDDEAAHLVLCLQYIKAITINATHMLSNIMCVDSLYPPFFGCTAAVFGLLFGKSTIVFAMTNVLFLAGTFFCLYLIGKKIGDWRLGILASCILSLYPMFFHLSRMFMLEIAVCFMVVASITVLIYSEGFKKTNFSILFGVFFGLGMLTKQYTIVFVIGPTLYVFTSYFFKENSDMRKKMVINFLLSLIVGVSMASLWYIPNFKKMVPRIISSAFDPSMAPKLFPVFSSRSIFYYLNILIKSQILLFFTLVFVVALFIVFRRKKDSFLFLCLYWIIVPYIVLTLFKNKYYYYTMAYSPAVALLSAYGILNIINKIYRRVMILAVLILGFFQFFVISYVDFAGKEPSILPDNLILRGVRYSPLRGDYKINDIILRMVQESDGKKILLWLPHFMEGNILAKNKARVQDNYVGLNLSCLMYNLLSRSISCKIEVLNHFKETRPEDNLEFILSPDILENINFYNINIEKSLFLDTFIMPDGSKVYLYKLK